MRQRSQSLRFSVPKAFANGQKALGERFRAVSAFRPFVKAFDMKPEGAQNRAPKASLLLKWSCVHSATTCEARFPSLSHPTQATKPQRLRTADIYSSWCTLDVFFIASILLYQPLSFWTARDFTSSRSWVQSVDSDHVFMQHHARARLKHNHCTNWQP